MASNFLTFTVELPNKGVVSLRREIQSYSGGTARTHMKREAVRALMNIQRGMLAMTKENLAYARFAVATACATGTATLASVADSDTIVVGGTTLTAKTTPSGSSQWKRGVSNTADAAALAACINANTTTNKIVRATSSGAVVTITSLYPGPIGNLVTLSQTGGTMTLSPATALGSGASDAVDGYDFGYTPTV